MMSWILRQRIKEFFRSSHWISPMTGLVLALIVAPLSRLLDQKTQWTLLDYSQEGARAILGILSGSMLTITLFVFTMLLLAVQIAAGQLTPRVIASAFRNRPTRLSSGLFVFTFIYSLATFGRIQEPVPQLPVFLGIVFSVISIGAFLFLIEYFAKSLRPIAVMTRIAKEGRRVIEKVYPQLLEFSPAVDLSSQWAWGKDFQTLPYPGNPGVLVAFDLEGLKELAKKYEGAIDLVPEVGDFVSTDDSLFRLYGGAVRIPPKKLLESVELGSERTLPQDPAFAFRIIVDVSIRALSPAINDPTTAVLGLDQLHRLLLQVGRRRLRDEGIFDEAGTLRLLIRTPNWEDFVLLAVREIRSYGAGSLQVCRRLRAMLEDLMGLLPDSRLPPLKAELTLLQRSVEKNFVEMEDRRRAEEADSQGLGGTQQGSFH